jgi:hypothetical protein
MLILFSLLFGCLKFINDYIYVNNNLIYEEELIGLELEEINNTKNVLLNSLLYSPLNYYNNYINKVYVGNKLNISNIYLFDTTKCDNILKIINSYKYSDSILNIINNKNKKLILNEINISKVYLFNKYGNNLIIYSDNKNNIFYYYIKKSLLIKYYYLLIMYYFIKYFFCTNFWT